MYLMFSSHIIIKMPLDLISLIFMTDIIFICHQMKIEIQLFKNIFFLLYVCLFDLDVNMSTMYVLFPQRP